MNHWSLAHRIRSDVPLRLPPLSASGAIDLNIHAAHTPDALLHRVACAQQIAHNDDVHRTRVTLLQFDDDVHGIDFMRGDLQLRIVHRVGTPDVHYASSHPIAADELATVLEGPVLGWALRLKSHALLHAAGVGWRGKHIAISAIPGAGKSTLAALLCREGATQWADDILAYEPHTATAFADGRPRRLSDASRELVGSDASATEEIYDGAHKSFASDIPTLDEALLHAQRLHHVVVLGPRTTESSPIFRPLRGAEALAAVLNGRYPSWLRSPVFDADAFESAGALIEKVPVTLVHMPQGLQRLDAAMVEFTTWLDATLADAHH